MAKTSKFIEIAKANRIEPKVIYDLGSFDGEQAVELSEAWPQAEVFSFEPVPELLERVLVKTKARRKIHVLNFAVNSIDGVVEFASATGSNKECGSLLAPNGAYFEPMPTAPIKVSSLRLDTFIEQMGHPAPDLIWMDVQGAELKALEGLGRWLSGVRMIWTEVAYKSYYVDQPLASHVDDYLRARSFERVFESIGIPGWFGDACYRR